MNIKKKGGKLIGIGSNTCVFKPNLPCLNKDVKIDNNKISKLFLELPKNFKKEIKFNEKIEKLKNYKEYAVTLSNLCKSDDYEKLKTYEPDIDKCIKENDINNFKSLEMLYGDYGGISMENRLNELFNRDVFDNEKLLKKTIDTFMKECYSLFYGLSEFYLNNITHLDIKPDNIVYKNGKFKYIDFGISTTFDNEEDIKNRSEYEYESDRIYIQYPFEFIYMYANSFGLFYENVKYRDNYNYIKDINNIVFYRDFDKSKSDIIDLTKDNKINKDIIIQRLDVYSLGMTITQLLTVKIIETYKELNNKDSIINKIQDIYCCESVYPYTELLYKMTEPLCINRITPIIALNELKKILNPNSMKLTQKRMLTK